jgi:hypothetical protein
MTTEFYFAVVAIVGILIATYVDDADLGRTRDGSTPRGSRSLTSSAVGSPS